MNPRNEYSARLSARRDTLARLIARDSIVANLRLVVFLAIAAIALAWWAGWLKPWWVAAPIAPFVALVIFHDRIIRAKERAAAGVAHYEHAVARIEGRWAGTGIPGDEFVPPEHPYAADLDLFGRGSLFELLCTPRTRAGQATLAAWLCAPAVPAEIAARQEAVEELRERLDLREDLALTGELVRNGVASEVLIGWASAAAVFQSTWPRRIAVCATVLSLATLFGLFKLGMGIAPFGGALALGAVVAYATRFPVQSVLHRIDEPRRELGVLALALDRLECEPFQCARLRTLRTALGDDVERASRHIARLHRLATLHEARSNQLFAPIAMILVWDLHFAYSFETWRLRHRSDIARWLHAVGELEALCALAAYTFEHPDDVFPEVVGAEACGMFEGKNLGHPLLTTGKCVRNDVRLNDETRLLVVSGSNMSGKSTMLRTVGINAVLAQAGAPVCASSLRIRPMAVGATLRIQDSIRDGSSRFYAEISRLRQLMDLAKNAPPLLFLLDELLAGTNSHDRRIGAEGILRGFVEAGAVGLVTTHDLALADIAASLAPHASNVHFADHLEDGRLVFDYRLNEGIVTKSNALALMRSVGLDV